MISSSRFVPMFGVAPHTPAMCAEHDANPRPKRRRKQTATGPCGTCGGRIKDGSVMVCMSCHRVAADYQARVGAHAYPPLDYDRRKGDGLDKQREKAKADAKKVRLTAKQRRGLLQDARAGEQPLPIVQAFLDQAG